MLTHKRFEKPPIICVITPEKSPEKLTLASTGMTTTEIPTLELRENPEIKCIDEKE